MLTLCGFGVSAQLELLVCTDTFCARRSPRPWGHGEGQDTLFAQEAQQASMDTGCSEIGIQHFVIRLPQ